VLLSAHPHTINIIKDGLAYSSLPARCGGRALDRILRPCVRSRQVSILFISFISAARSDVSLVCRQYPLGRLLRGQGFQTRRHRRHPRRHGKEGSSSFSLLSWVSARSPFERWPPFSTQEADHLSSSPALLARQAGGGFLGLGSAKFSPLDIKRVYFGNWCVLPPSPLFLLSLSSIPNSGLTEADAVGVDKG
jgi:hypothetical protein